MSNKAFEIGGNLAGVLDIGFRHRLWIFSIHDFADFPHIFRWHVSWVAGIAFG